MSTHGRQECLPHQSVTLNEDEDIEIGSWSMVTRTFTPFPDGDPRVPSAVRVTSRRTTARGNPVPLFFGPVVNYPTADVDAIAVAMIEGGTYKVGIVGIDFIKMNGVSSTDSWNSGAENAPIVPYDPNSPNSNGHITSNGTITLVGQADVNGDAFYCPAPDTISMTSKTEVGDPYGAEYHQLQQELVFPPVNPHSEGFTTYNNNAALQAKYPSNYTAVTTNPLMGNFKVGSQNSVVLEGNNPIQDVNATHNGYTLYYFHDFNVQAGGTLTIKGKVAICVTGELKIAGNVSTVDWTNLTSRPGDFRIRVVGPGEVTISGTSDIYADIYAPEAPCTFNGLGGRNPLGLFGCIVGKSLTVNGNSDLHYDENLGFEFEIIDGVRLVK